MPLTETCVTPAKAKTDIPECLVDGEVKADNFSKTWTYTDGKETNYLYTYKYMDEEDAEQTERERKALQQAELKERKKKLRLELESWWICRHNK